MSLTISIVTADRTFLERDDVTRLVVPGADGQLTLLPGHAPLVVSLAIGEMLVHAANLAEPVAVHGGFLQIVNDEVNVLADAAERVEDIDEERADAARRRAEERIAGRLEDIGEADFDLVRAQLSIQRALLRDRVRQRN